MWTHGSLSLLFWADANELLTRKVVGLSVAMR